MVLRVITTGGSSNGAERGLGRIDSYRPTYLHDRPQLSPTRLKYKESTRVVLQTRGLLERKEYIESIVINRTDN